MMLAVTESNTFPLLSLTSKVVNVVSSAYITAETNSEGI